MALLYKLPYKTETIKGAKIFSLENVELEKLNEQGKQLFAYKGTLKVIYFECKKAFALQLENWMYILRQTLPTEACDDHVGVYMYVFPAVDGIYTLKISKRDDKAAVAYFEMLLGNASRLNREGGENHMKCDAMTLGLMKAHSFGLLEEVNDEYYAKNHGNANGNEKGEDHKMRKRDKLKRGFQKMAEKMGRSHSKPEISIVPDRIVAPGLPKCDVTGKNGHEYYEFDKREIEDAICMTNQILKTLDESEECPMKNGSKNSFTDFMGAMKDGFNDFKDKVYQKMNFEKDSDGNYQRKKSKEMTLDEYMKTHPQDIIVYKKEEPVQTVQAVQPVQPEEPKPVTKQLVMASAEYRPCKEDKKELSIIVENEEENMGDSIKSRREVFCESFKEFSTGQAIESPLTGELEYSHIGDSGNHDDHQVPRISNKLIEKQNVFSQNISHMGSFASDDTKSTGIGISHMSSANSNNGMKHKPDILHLKHSQSNKENLNLTKPQTIVRTHKSDSAKDGHTNINSEDFGSSFSTKHEHEHGHRNIFKRLKNKLSIFGKSHSDNTDRRIEHLVRTDTRNSFDPTPIKLNSPSLNKNLMDSPMLHPSFISQKVALSGHREPTALYNNEVRLHGR